jgi:hypothetical protein
LCGAVTTRSRGFSVSGGNYGLFKFDKSNAHAYFIIFVAKALKKLDRKYYHQEQMSRIYCDGERIIATDGHRLHMYTPAECPLPKGLFMVEKKNKTTIHLSHNKSNEYDKSLFDKYPDIDRIIPEETNAEEFAYSGVDAKLADVIRVMGSGCLNIGYFKDAVSAPEIRKFHVTSELEPVVMIGDKLMSIIMPMRCQ